MLQQHFLTEEKLSDRFKAIESISAQIDRSNSIEDILIIIIKQTRRLLQCDRLIVYQFMPDWNGRLVAESVGAGWKSLSIESNSDESSNDCSQQDRSRLRDKLATKADLVEPDTFLRETKGGKYAYGAKFSAIDDIYTQGFPDCYLESLEKYQAKAYLMVPIYQNQKLWGLLGAYQNDGSRIWQQEEIDLTKDIIARLSLSLQRIVAESPKQIDVATNLKPKQPLGEILIEAGLVSIHQIQIALQEQKNHQLKIGEILANHGWIQPKTVNFFAEKWSRLVEKQPNRPLALYLLAAALLNRQQLLILKQRQQKANSKTELHFLAVEQGYIKQETVDFFLKHLYQVKPAGLSFAESYEIIKSYHQGETDFQNKQLIQVPLNGVSLKGIVLNNSNLVQANLSQTNLSNSSFVGANLSLANLRSANLSHANFTKACFIEANLRQSNLEQANFKLANLQETDLREANLLNTSFAGADLRGAKLKPVSGYKVYYDPQTRFDPNFNPIKAGWKLR